MAEAAGGIRGLAVFPQQTDGDSSRATARPAAWKLTTLTGRLTELSSSSGPATLTLAFSLVLDAQHEAEPVGWVTARGSCFFPPDVADGGVDLESLVVIRLPAARQIPRAAEHLARSGAFGLLVLDLGPSAQILVPMQMRLLGLAQKHQTAVLCLTRKEREAPSLGSLVSLRAEASYGPVDAKNNGVGAFACTAEILKDKRCGPGWTHREVCRGPDGLC